MLQNTKKSRVLCQGRTEFTEVPDTGINVQNLQKFRVRVRKCYRSHRSSEYCGTGTELTEVPGRYANAVPVPRVFVARAYRAHRVPGTGLKVVQNLQKFRVRV